MRGIPLTYQYSKHLQLLCYDPDNNSIIVIDQDRDHNAYLITRDRNIPKERYIIGEKFVSMFCGVKQKEMIYKKIDVVNPGNIPKLRERLMRSWENRIFYHLRYVYDKMIVYGCEHILETKKESGRCRLPFSYEGDLIKFFGQVFEQPFPWIKRCAVDMEVYSSTGTIPNVDKAIDPITTISICGNDNKKYLLMIADFNKIEENAELVFPDGMKVIVNLEFFKSEKDLVKRANFLILQYPVIVTQFGDGFDLPYLWKRSKNLDVESKIREKRIGTLRYWGIEDRVHIDIVKFYQNQIVRKELFHNAYAHSKLGELARTLIKKEKFEMPSFQEYDPKAMGIYCLNDSMLALELTAFDDDMVMKAMIMMCRVANCDIEFLSRKRISNWIRSYYHFFHKILNYVVPDDKDFERFNAIPLDYRGAIVLDPDEMKTVGYHFDVWGVDFGSLYPSNVDNDNISYDTVLCDHEECKSNKVPGYDNLWICTKRRGILSEIFGTIKDLRLDVYKKVQKEYDDRYRDKHYNSIDWDDDKILLTKKGVMSEEELRIMKGFYKIVVDILRIYINAGYGVFADEDLEDLYCLPVPCSITAYAREKIMLAKSISEEFGAKVLLGHTDSLYLKNMNKKQISVLTDMITKRTQVPFEIQGHYKFMSVWKKGNYVVVDDNGEVTIKGLMGKKAHVYPYTKKGFSGIMDIVKTIDDEGLMKSKQQEIINLVKRYKDDLESGNVSFEDISSEITLHIEVNKGKGQTYNLARMIKERINPRIEAGDSIKIVPAKKDIFGETAIPLDMLLKKEDCHGKRLMYGWDVIDKDKIIENIASVFRQILEPLGIDVEDAMKIEKKVSKGRGIRKVRQLPSKSLEYFFGNTETKSPKEFLSSAKSLKVSKKDPTKKQEGLLGEVIIPDKKGKRKVVEEEEDWKGDDEESDSN